MSEEVATINGDAGAPSVPASQSGGLVETMDVKQPEPAQQDTDPGDKPAGDDTGKTGDTQDDLETRFDQHPRFQEINTRMKDAEAGNAELKVLNQQLQTRLDKLEAAAQATAAQSTGQPQGKLETLLGDMTDEQIQDKMDDDPSFLRQMLSAVREDTASDILGRLNGVEAEREQNTRIQKTYDDYADANPDFREMWDSQQIQTYMDQHPGHNAISAHMAMTAEAKQSSEAERIEAAVKQAIEETEDRIRKDIQAGRQSASLGSPTGRPSNQDNNELKDTSRAGGVTAVLANRLSRMRKAI